MSDDKSIEETMMDPITGAISYGTVWTNRLFERSRSEFKFSRGGKSLIIPWAGLIWGGVFALIFGAITALIVLKIFAAGSLGIPIVVFFAGLGGIIGYKVGLWSPMQKTTGEDLITYIIITLRNRFARGGKKIATTKLNSLAVGGENGVMVTCTRWLGTQPLYNAPPMSIYDEEDYRTEYHIVPRGELKVLSSDDYKDGLGDRSF